MIVLPDPLVFDWDDGNRNKNRLGHGISCEECEQVFYDRMLRLLPDLKHSANEPRSYAYGKTEKGVKLLVSFTLRPKGIRPISVRRANSREQKKYEERKA